MRVQAHLRSVGNRHRLGSWGVLVAGTRLPRVAASPCLPRACSPAETAVANSPDSSTCDVSITIITGTHARCMQHTIFQAHLIKCVRACLLDDKNCLNFGLPRQGNYSVLHVVPYIIAQLVCNTLYDVTHAVDHWWCNLQSLSQGLFIRETNVLNLKLSIHHFVKDWGVV